MSAAIACHYTLGKHATSTTNETYRHLSAYLNVEMRLLHFQRVHQEKFEYRAVIGTRHAQPLLCQGGPEPTATAKKIGLDLSEIGREWEHKDGGSNTSPGSLKRPIVPENTIHHLSLPEGKHPLYPLQAFGWRNELPALHVSVDLTPGIHKFCLLGIY